MKKPGFMSLLLFVLLPLAAAGQEAGHNYVTARTMLSAGGSEFFDVVTYYDGYGYPYETVRKGAGGSGGNVATVLRYDRSRRVAEEWLPTATGLDYLAPAEFYSAARSATGDQYPYARYGYEDSPTGRITSRHTPGEDYAQCPALVAYGTNTASGDYACTRYEAADEGLRQLPAGAAAHRHRHRRGRARGHIVHRPYGAASARPPSDARGEPRHVLRI